MPVTGNPISSDPSAPVVSLTAAKNYLRVDGTDQDSVILDAVNFATDFVQRETRQQLLLASKVHYLDKFPATFAGISLVTGTIVTQISDREIVLPFCPVQSVDSVVYTFGGSPVTLSTSLYTADVYNVADGEVRRGRIVLNNVNGNASWPVTDDVAKAVKISYTAGYGTADQVPAPFKQAIYWMTSHVYENREIILQGTKKPLEVPWSLRALLEQLMFRDAYAA